VKPGPNQSGGAEGHKARPVNDQQIQAIRPKGSKGRESHGPLVGGAYGHGDSLRDSSGGNKTNG
jgi:hypothetical protein